MAGSEPDPHGAPVRRFTEPGYHAPDFNGGFEGLADVVEAAYRALVGGYIACEQNYFGRTEPIPPSSPAKDKP